VTSSEGICVLGPYGVFQKSISLHVHNCLWSNLHQKQWKLLYRH
jgi:hypothetical protein